ncbi:MAG: CapA family protein [Helicobacteraceae bacterium]|nr:CapA family protein [Helicobacteraceae bacterium]
MSGIGAKFGARRAALALIAGVLLAGCAVKQTPPPPQVVVVEKHPKERQEINVTLIAVGDNLIHKQLINRAKTKDGYDFAPFYQEVASVVKAADIAFINQETLISGERFGYSGYPAFNGPNEIGEAIYNLGFRAINHATNHAMDKGKKALLATMDYWKTKSGAIVLGVHASQKEREKPKIVEKGGVKIGFLAYTYGLNGIKLPKDSPYLVSLIDTKAMEQEIDALRKLCDFLVVSMHWGDEYARAPNKTQEKLARFLADRKVDLVIGHHPHVLQGARWIERKDGAKTLVYFSLGNFISAQNKKPRMLGGMAKVVLTSRDNNVSYKSAELLGVVTHFEKGASGFKVYLLDDYTQELANRHALSAKPEKLDLTYLRKLYDSVVPKSFRNAKRP